MQSQSDAGAVTDLGCLPHGPFQLGSVLDQVALITRDHAQPTQRPVRHDSTTGLRGQSVGLFQEWSCLARILVHNGEPALTKHPGKADPVAGSAAHLRTFSKRSVRAPGHQVAGAHCRGQPGN